MIAKKPKIVFVHPAIRTYREKLFEFLSVNFDCRYIFVEDYQDNVNFFDKSGININKYSIYKGKRFLFYSKGATFKILKDVYSDFDIWIASGLGHFSTHLALPLVKLRGKKFVLFAEDWWLSKKLKQSAFRPIAKIIARNCDAIIVASTKSRDFFISLDAKPERIFLGLNATKDYGEIPLDENKLNRIKAELNTAEKFNILYLGRIVSYKGLDILLKSIVKLNAKFDNLQLLVVGDGSKDYKRYCEELIKYENILNVKFIEKIDEAELPYYYKSANVFVLPARYEYNSNVVAEAWGFTVNEALSCGLPVVSTDAVAAAVDLIKNGVNGFIAQQNNADDLADKLEYFIINENDFSLATIASMKNVRPINQFEIFGKVINMLDPNKIRVMFTGRELRQRRRETIMNPPEGVEFSTLVPVSSMKPDYHISKLKRQQSSLILKLIKSAAERLHIPNIRWVGNKLLKNIDLIYTPGQLILNRKNYIVEIDNPACLSRYNLKTLIKRKKLIELFLQSRYCKKIICISEAAKKSMAYYFGPAVRDKCAVVYPYVKLNEYKKQGNENKVILLSCNTKFYMKGNREVLKVFEKLQEKFKQIELWLISNTPQEFIDKYQGNQAIKFIPAKFNKVELYEKYYSQCDIFVQPTYQDSFGLIYLELMASGKPIVTTDIYAIPEMVVDGYNGFLVRSPLYMYNENDYALKEEYFPIDADDTEEEFYKQISADVLVDDFVDRLAKLIEDPELRGRMGDNSLMMVKERFSEVDRKEKLLEIFKNSL